MVSNSNSPRKISKRIKTKLCNLTDSEYNKLCMDHFSQSIKDHVVDGVEDVPPDGHYGYRCCAEMLNLSAEDGSL